MVSILKGVVADEVAATARDELVSRAMRNPVRFEVQGIREACLVRAVRPSYMQERSKVD